MGREPYLSRLSPQPDLISYWAIRSLHLSALGFVHRSSGRAVRSLHRLLDLKRTYPPEAFEKAVIEALQYGLYDLARLEQMILSYVAGDFFNEEP